MNCKVGVKNFRKNFLKIVNNDLTSSKIYSIMFTIKLFEYMFSQKNNNMRNMLKKYSIIYLFTIFISIISSLSEAYLLPILMKIIINIIGLNTLGEHIKEFMNTKVN